MLSRGSISDWKSRDHSLFICYAPTDVPRYAMSVVIEHGTFGARAAAPIAKDVMTFLFDPPKAMEVLTSLEQAWGGTPAERLAAKSRAFAAQYGTTAPKVETEEALKAAEEKADKQADEVPVQAATPQVVKEEPSPVPRGSDQPPSLNPSAIPSDSITASPVPVATPNMEAL
jgi:penicillin-binding protein 2